MDLTTAGSTVGTLAYMSPEQARGETLDSRSDLFSLGVVLYEMATRHVPFPGATSALVFVKLLNQAPEPVRDWNDSVPRELEKIILKLMAKERTARYQTAQELVDALNQVNEKGGGWLRKAAAVVPLVRAPDPAARGKRLGSRTGRSSRRNDAPDAPMTPDPAALDSNPPRSSSGSEPAQFLRPVARMPRGDGSPRPSSSMSAIGATKAPDSTETAIPEAPAAPTPLAADGAKGGVSQAARTIEDRPLPPAFSDALVRAPGPLPAAEAETELTPSGAFPQALPAQTNHMERRARQRRIYVAVAAGILVVVLAAAYYLRARGHFGSALLSSTEPVVVTTIENRTGDKLLDGTVAQALSFALQQSPYLLLRSPESFAMVQHQRTAEGEEPEGPVAVHDLAKRLKTSAYLLWFREGQHAALRHPYRPAEYR